MTGTAQQIKGCIFNLDGVIVDTTRYHFQAWQRLAVQLGFDLPKQISSELKGIGRIASLEKVLSLGNIYMPEAEKMHWADVKHNWYLDLVANMKPGEVLPGVLFFLRQLRESGIKTAVVSASQNAKAVLKSTKIESFFDLILDGSVIKKPKPDPQGFLLAAFELNLAPAQCAVFEDSDLGIKTALFGGFSVIGVGKDSELSNAHLVVQSFENVNINALFDQLISNPVS